MLAKLKEWLSYPSSWTAIIGVLTMIGIHISPEQSTLTAQAGVAVVTAIFAFFSDSDVAK